MKREDLEAQLKKVQSLIDEKFRQLYVDKTRTHVALRVELMLHWYDDDDALLDPMDATGAPAGLTIAIFEVLDQEAIEGGLMPQSVKGKDGHLDPNVAYIVNPHDEYAEIHSPSYFHAYLVDTDNDEVLVRLTPDGVNPGFTFTNGEPVGKLVIEH